MIRGPGLEHPEKEGWRRKVKRKTYENRETESRRSENRDEVTLLLLFSPPFFYRSECPKFRGSTFQN